MAAEEGSTALWTPDGNGDKPQTPGIIVPGRKVRHRCNFCPAEFYDTGDADADDKRFLRHFERCWKREGEDVTGAELEMRRNEPLAQTDKEQVDWLRADAEKRKDTTVKGVTGWADRMKREQRRKRRG